MTTRGATSPRLGFGEEAFRTKILCQFVRLTRNPGEKKTEGVLLKAPRLEAASQGFALAGTPVLSLSILHARAKMVYQRDGHL